MEEVKEAKRIPTDEDRRFLNFINKLLSSSKGSVHFLAILEVIRYELRSCSCKHAYEYDRKLLKYLLDSPKYTVIKDDVWLTERYAAHLSKKKVRKKK